MRTALFSLFALSACSETALLPVGETFVPPGEAFDNAEARTGVPMELLLAIAKVETGVRPIVGASEFPGQEPAFGVMGLRGENLVLGARLAGLTEEQVRTDVASNTLAAATLLASWAEEDGIDSADLAAWAPLVARYSGIESEQAAAEYVWYEVYAALATGVSVEGYQSEPAAAEPRYPRPTRGAERTGDGSAIWSYSPNYNSRYGASVDFVVIHTCEGTYSGCWGWLTNSAAGVSAHYVVNDDGSEVRQLVDEDDRAWHIGANYDCDNNSGVECWRDGTSMNTISVGIEHAGYASQSSWDAGLLARSAELTCGITDRHGIVRDSYHIVGHGQMQPWDRTDPGANWPWTSYIDQVKAACGEGSTAPVTTTPTETTTTTPPSAGSPTSAQFVIDSNNAANDLSWYDIEVSASWWASTNVAGYWNTGYWVAPTEAVSDPARFWFYSDTDRCYTVDAWWTSAWDRPTAVTYIGWDEWTNEVGRATVDQTWSGSQWNELGDWRYPAGWNQVLLSRWTTGGSYAIADAVRLTPCN
jgi:N-acetyl-anhydromuramyl-L-alanine amidase AmpD